MLVNSNVIRPNYKNEMIPVGMGIVFFTYDDNKQYNIRIYNYEYNMGCR